ncbi:hypothetical protein L596_029505 [Steinernema carpocapsae]|uniref:Uncharacterized protein n=1 Tax=Steinernema carpocapsae TaxID=34508 RepID=A0A4U5LUV3_STECR|nr:hypothetical protein L596_029505 [Steinernema carpocapsae]
MKETQKKTKRTIFSQVAQVYDPLGLLAPVLVQARVFSQNLWISHDWDTQVSPETWECWLQIHGRIQGFTKTLPRSVCPIGAEVDLVVFTDASGCDGHVHLPDPSRYVPPTPEWRPNVPPFHEEEDGSSRRFQDEATSTPEGHDDPEDGTRRHLTRNEATQQRHDRSKEQHQGPEVRYQTDSQIALEWIRAPRAPAKQGAFVLNRWKELRALQATLESYHHELWTGYVRTDENPADCATRGLSKDELGDHNWWIGPDYLSKDFEDWPNDCKFQQLEREADAHDPTRIYRTTPEDPREQPTRLRGSHRAERASGNNGWNSTDPTQQEVPNVPPKDPEQENSRRSRSPQCRTMKSEAGPSTGTPPTTSGRSYVPRLTHSAL